MNLSQAIGRLILAGRDLTRFAGYTVSNNDVNSINKRTIVLLLLSLIEDLFSFLKSPVLQNCLMYWKMLIGVDMNDPWWQNKILKKQMLVEVM